MQSRKLSVEYIDSLTENERLAIEQQKSNFPMILPAEFAERIDWTNPDDPLRRQVVPGLEEMIRRDDETADPLQERNAMPLPGVIHKYYGRVLWLVTTCCPVHCRFCFRRGSYSRNDYSGLDVISLEERLDGICKYLATHPEVSEVILSGGDPLMLSREAFEQVINRVSELDQIRFLRIHTRVPVIFPDHQNCRAMSQLKLPVSFRVVVHVNHPGELGPSVCNRLTEWRSRGLQVLAQTVLLKGVNDSESILRKLMVDLAYLGVQPYYLHQLDPAIGTSHFRVSDNSAHDLLLYLKTVLPGYAVPKLVRDTPGCAFKTEI